MADQEEKKRIGAFADLRGINLRGMDLAGAFLHDSNMDEADLSEADLSGASLYRVSLHKANLSKANLRGADLRWALLLGTVLQGAQLEGVRLDQHTSFEQADLSETALCGIHWSDVDLRKTKLRSADLYKADLSGANLCEADLSGTDLREADLSGANLREADLRGANLCEADLRGANLIRAKLRGAVLLGANLEQAILTGASLAHSDLREAKLRSADLRKADLRGADVRGADLSQADLRAANPPKADVGGSAWNGANLEGARLGQVLLPGAGPETNPIKILLLQEHLTPEQKALARHFTQERLAMLFSCAPVDEAQAVWHLREAYDAIKVELPPVRWFDSPFTFLRAHTSWKEWEEFVDDDDISALLDPSSSSSPWRRAIDRCVQSVSPSLWANAAAIVSAPLEAAVQKSGMAAQSAWEAIWSRVKDTPEVQKLIKDLRLSCEFDIYGKPLKPHFAIGHRRHGLFDEVTTRYLVNSGPFGPKKFSPGIVWRTLEASASRSICAYEKAAPCDLFRFWQENLNSNELADLIGLTHFVCFNEMVSGYRLGRQSAWLVRKPRHLRRDEEGRLHHASGMCLQYRDDWGLYAWHGVPVPKKVILRPETLSEKDFRRASAAVQRVMRERLGVDRSI